jgi:hypothetical protein
MTERVSVSTTGEEADGASNYSALSADGRYVAFSSSATNLLSGDTNRSRADLAAVGEMVRAGWQDQKIFAAFACDEWPIGERFRELYLRE